MTSDNVGTVFTQKPEEPEPWTDEFVADTLGPACPQEPIGVLWLTHLLWDRFDESCLHLNIYAPTVLRSSVLEKSF